MADHFGLDIGSDSIKILQLKKEKDSFHLVAAGIAKNPVGNLPLEAEGSIVALAETIKKLKNEAKVGTSSVVTALPERSTFSQVIEIPKMKEEELSQAIPWEAENVIPQPLSEVNLDWEVIEDGESAKNNQMKILLVAAPVTLVNWYLQVLKMAGLEAAALEIESLAQVRCLKSILSQGDLLLTNCGLKSFDITLVSKGNLALTRQLPSGGEAITRAISNSLGLDLPTAEEYKKTYGLSEQLEGKVALAVVPILAAAGNEIKKTVRYYEEKGGSTLKLMIMSGGTSLMPGIAEYFTKTVGLEVQIANPFSLLSGSQQNSEFLKKNSPLFTVAAGLAMKGK